MISKHVKYLVLVAVLALMLVSGAAMAQTPAEAVAYAVANSGAFPFGTTVVNLDVSGGVAVADLSPEAIATDFGEAASDAMTKAIADALGDFPDITTIEITVSGKPIWQYLPAPAVAPAASSDASVMALGSGPVSLMSTSPSANPAVPSVTSELAGHKIALHPSHGSYYVNYTSNGTPVVPPWWNRAQRTLCGPNPVTGKQPGDPRYYQPSDYYFYTRGFQWPSMYEDDISPETIRFLKAYLQSSGAQVFVSRELDKNYGDMDVTQIGYPAASFATPFWQMAAMYNLRAKGYPQWIWSAFLRDYDADIRARPYYANYVGADLSLSLHSNAAGSGNARGTETYAYPNQYPVEQARSVEFSQKLQSAVVGAINNYFDDGYAKATYVKGTSNPPEWSSSWGTYPGYLSWYNRGPKTGNYGEIREAKCPAALMEIAFHDDWKFFPDEMFLMDQIWRAHAAWGIYEGILNFYGVPLKPRMAATVDSVSFPAFVKPGDAVSGTIAMKNLGLAWCWGDKFTAATKTYGPYTVWFLKAAADDQFGAAGTEIAVPQGMISYPGDTAAFNASLTAPATDGYYTTKWQMIKDDAKGGSFGDIASAQIGVDGTAPEIAITSPAPAPYPYGPITFSFSATDAMSGVDTVTADVDGTPVKDGQTISTLGIGAHTLTVVAKDKLGNTATQQLEFTVVNSVGKVTVGGWIELADKKGTCGFECDYTAGAPAPTGNLTYQDHDTGMTIKSIKYDGLGIVGNHAWIYGTCTIDGQGEHVFRVDVIDNGEPGSNDVFNISLDTGYSKGDKLGGGNVTIH